jgi:predicted Holliday junction resolvase-like endonuclease
MNKITCLFSREKQEARDHMIGYLGSLQKRAEADYDTQIFRAQAQREEKELREAQEKLDKQQKMQEAINKHRQETVRIGFNTIKSRVFIILDETT